MTKMTTSNITDAAARLIALHEAGLDAAEFISCELEDGYWVIEFTACELRYTCYVDAGTGFVPGITFEPVPVEAYPDDGTAAAGFKVA